MANKVMIMMMIPFKKLTTENNVFIVSVIV